MPIFELRGPDGSVYEVNAPDEAKAVAAFKRSTMPDSRIAGAFEAATAQPKHSITPEHRNYGFTEAVLSSLPFGDEVAAAGGAAGRYLAGKTGLAPEIGIGRAYQQTRALERTAQEEYQQAHPAASIGASVLGIAALGAPRALLSPQAAQVAFPATLGGQMRQGLTQGTAIGGLYGAGEGEGLVERGKSALTGGAVGAGTGAAAPVALAGVTGLIRGATAPVRTAAANRLMPEHRATGIVEEAFRRDQIPIGQAATDLAAARRVGPETMLADVGGTNVRNAVRGVVNTPGEGAERVLAKLAARNLGQPDRIANAVRQTLKDPQTFGQTATRLASEREHVAGPLYRQAFAQKTPINVSGVVKYIDDQIRPGVNQAARPLADLRPDGITATLGKLRGYFKTARNQRVDLEALHRVKMEIDDIIGSAKRSGDLSKARAVLGVKTELMKAMSPKGSLYDRARQIYASTHEMEEALEIGQNLFRHSADSLKAELAGMTTAQKEMVQLGAARAIKEQIDKVRDGRDVVKTIFGSKHLRDAIKTAFQNDQAFRRFQGALMRETTMRSVYDSATGNSTTAKQLANLLDQSGGAIGRDVFGLLIEGRPVQAVAAAVRQAVLGEKGISEAVANRMADMLLSADPKQIAAAMRALSARQGAVDRLAQRLSAAQQLTGQEGAGGGAKYLAR